MARLNTIAVIKARRGPARRKAELTLVAPSAAPVERESGRCLILQGVGHPECHDFYVALEAMEQVAQLLRSAIERAGRTGQTVGKIEKSSTFEGDEGQWKWKLRVEVPSAITAAALELAKHLAGRKQLFVDPICLVPKDGYSAA